MNKTFIIIFFCFSVIIISCKKDSSVQEPAILTHLFFANKVPEAIKLSLKIDDNELVDINSNVNLVSIEGKHSVVLFNSETNETLLDTSITTSKEAENSFMFFRTDPADKMQLLRSINIDTVTAPQEGYIKVSLANFSRHLPQNIEIVFVQENMYTGEVDTSAIFSNPGKAFSNYKSVKMYSLPGDVFNTAFKIVLRDTETKTELAFITDPVTGEPIDWSWYIGFEATPLYPQQRIFSLYLYSLAEDPSAPNHFSTFINNF